MTPLRLLDLFCGAGGAGMGYHRAGFEVVGVDIKPQKHYPFEFHQADALEYLREHGQEFDAIHASPPCQRYSRATPNSRRDNHPDMLPATRDVLLLIGKPWIIENVPGAPMQAHIIICGCQVGLQLRRKRLFEASWNHLSLTPACQHDGPVVSVVGHGTPSWVREQLGYNPTIQQYRDAMGIDWMTRNELSQAIPPAYTEYIGRQLREWIEAHS